MKCALFFTMTFLVTLSAHAVGAPDPEPKLRTLFLTSDRSASYFKVTTTDSCETVFQTLLAASDIQQLDSHPDDVTYEIWNRGCTVTINGMTYLDATARIMAKTLGGNQILEEFANENENARFYDDIIHLEFPESVVIRYEVQAWTGGSGSDEGSTGPKLIAYEPGSEFNAFGTLASQFRNSLNPSPNFETFLKFLNQSFPTLDALDYIQRVRADSDRLSLLGKPIYVLRKKSLNWKSYFRERYVCPSQGQCIR